MIPLVYDQVNRWGKDDAFFIALLKKTGVKNIADLGCGTGRLTTHFAKEGLHITAIDPHEAAIATAKRKKISNCGKITWIIGDSSKLHANTYDAVIMTANVAQVFLTNDSWQQVIADVYHALKPGGHFIFDTRNPQAKIWEQWEKDVTPDEAVNQENGDPLEIWTSYEGFQNQIYTFYETVKLAQSGKVIMKEKIQLKFRTYEEIHSSLRKAGFSQIHVYGDWEFQEPTAETKSFIFHAEKRKTHHAQ